MGGLGREEVPACCCCCPWLSPISRETQLGKAGVLVEPPALALALVLGHPETVAVVGGKRGEKKGGAAVLLSWTGREGGFLLLGLKKSPQLLLLQHDPLKGGCIYATAPALHTISSVYSKPGVGNYLDHMAT